MDKVVHIKGAHQCLSLLGHQRIFRHGVKHDTKKISFKWMGTTFQMDKRIYLKMVNSWNPWFPGEKLCQ
jgi:hypothetical protein|tara:strand:- start:639 stop:845 length:207 start_codon:yes stop_codon:yes gene_type:complete